MYNIALRTEYEEIFKKEFPFMNMVNPADEKINELVNLEILDGWLPLVYKLCSEIKTYAKENDKSLEGFHILQIKQKYGELQFLTSKLIPGIAEIVQKYEKLSLVTCEYCGKTGKVRDDSWIEVLCDDCYRGK